MAELVTLDAVATVELVAVVVHGQLEPMVDVDPTLGRYRTRRGVQKLALDIPIL